MTDLSPVQTALTLVDEYQQNRGAMPAVVVIVSSDSSRWDTTVINTNVLEIGITQWQRIKAEQEVLEGGYLVLNYHYDPAKFFLFGIPVTFEVIE